MNPQQTYENYTILQILEIYANHRPVRTMYYKQVCSRVRKFVEFVGKAELLPSEVNNFMIQAFLNDYYEKNPTRSGYTVHGYKTSINAVLSLAKELINGKISTPKVIPQPPKAFDIEEMRQMINHAATLKGKLANGVKIKHFWRAAMHSAFSTGLRFGDLLSVEAGDIPENGELVIMQSKTGKPVTVRFSEAAMKFIKKHGHKMAFPWPGSQQAFITAFAILRTDAGVNHGTWKCFRRSAGSYANENGKGHLLLGNTQTVFEQHYRDPTISREEVPEQIAI